MKVVSVVARSSEVAAVNVLPRQADASLEQHLATLLRARAAMQEELRSTPVILRQRVAQRQLLSALERYVMALADRGLSAPPRLRDELGLQRQLAGGR